MLRRMRVVLNLRFLRRVNPKMRFILNLLFLNMQLVQILRIPHLKGIIGVILHMLRVQHLLDKGRGIPHLVKQIMKVVGSKGVSIDKFLNDVF